MNKGKMLRELLSNKEILIAPGAHNGLSAKIIEKVGFKAIYGTGYGASASYLGRPDVGLMTMTEMVTHMHNLASVVDIPVIADGDTGYGNAINVMRTTREYESAGLAAIQLEDQVMPKKCGHMLGRQIVPIEEMVGKIKAAVDARENPDFMIIARTDTRTKYGIEEVIKRIKAYEAAGADIIFAESLESEGEMIQVNESISVPSLANMVEKGRTPLMDATKLQGLGYKLVIWPVTSILVEAKAIYDVLTVLLQKGTTQDIVNSDLYDFEEFNKLLGLDKIVEVEKDYAGRY